MQLTDDSRAILLLCGRFAKRSTEAAPLNIRDYNKVARWLNDRKLRPRDLLVGDAMEQLRKEPSGLDAQRVQELIKRGAAMALAIETWSNKGIWVICRSDKHYPERMRSHLGPGAPPLFYGIGEPSLLNMGGVAVVGSRDIDSFTEEYTRQFGFFCSKQRTAVISGGARGVDTTAMIASLDEGGSAIGVLANDLLRTGVSGKYRDALLEKRLVLISPYNPDARFNVGNAMGRNKHIYCLADYALVVNSGLKGGTWEGANEELKRVNSIPIFVRMEGKLGEGNEKLMKKGAQQMPQRPWSGSIKKLFTEKTSASDPEYGGEDEQTTLFG